MNIFFALKGAKLFILITNDWCISKENLSEQIIHLMEAYLYRFRLTYFDTVIFVVIFDEYRLKIG